MVKLYLVRHGETIDNVNKILQGQKQGKLTDTGCKQAKILGEKLKSKNINIYISSDLKRSVDTCKLIIGNKNDKIITTKLLRERDWGSFTNKYIPSIEDLNNPNKWPKDIEPISDLKQRASEFILWIKSNYNGKIVLAVGHGIINKAIQSVYWNKPMNIIKPMANLEVRTLILK